MQDYLSQRLEDEFDYEVMQDREPLDQKVTARSSNVIFKIEKGQSYHATQLHWRNGEHHYLISGMGEIPAIFFEEYGQ